MFDDVAERYDLTNTVLSFGQDKGWRKATREALDLKPGVICRTLERRALFGGQLPETRLRS